MDASGAMLTGWAYLGNGWYYFGGNGAMYPGGWHIINNTYYYMHSNGSMAADTWIGSCYVNSSGAWVPDHLRVSAGWVQSGIVIRTTATLPMAGNILTDSGITLISPAGWLPDG